MSTIDENQEPVNNEDQPGDELHGLNPEGSSPDEATFEQAGNNERWDQATQASEPSYTLEPEKGIQESDPNENNQGADKDDFNVKQ